MTRLMRTALWIAGLLLIAAVTEADEKLAGPLGHDAGLDAYSNDTGGSVYFRNNTSERGQCVWFVRAVRPDQSLLSTRSNGGYPAQWARNMFPNAKADGFGTGPDPKPGAIMCFEAGGRYGAVGHVALVVAVGSNYIDVWESNFLFSEQVDKRRITDKSGLQGYIYAKGSNVPPILGSPPPDADIGRGAAHRQRFLDCFNRIGGRAVTGNPREDVHPVWSSGIQIQEFVGGSSGTGIMVENDGRGAVYWLPHVYRTKYVGVNGADSPLAMPNTDQLNAGRSRYGRNGGYVGFDGGGLILSTEDGTFILLNPYYSKWGSLRDWQGILGFPTSDAYDGPRSYHGTSSRLQNFEGGGIYGVPGGLFAVTGAIFQKWRQVGGAATPLGYPNEDEVRGLTSPQGYGGEGQVFEGGRIYSSEAGAFVIRGDILDKWRAIDGLSSYGFPKSDEADTPTSSFRTTGRYQKFAGGDIYKTSRGMFVIYGDELEAWHRANWVIGPLGLPLAAPIVAPPSTRGTTGELRRFEGGSVFRSSLGTFGVYGVISKAFTEARETAGSYGFPKSDARAEGNQIVQDFEGGTIRANQSGSSIIRLSSRLVSSASPTTVELILTNSGDGTAQSVVVEQLQLGTSAATGIPWSIGDLSPGGAVTRTFQFSPGIGDKKASILSATVRVGESKQRLRSRVVKP